MSMSSPLVDAIIEGWKEYQQQLAVILRSLTPEQLAIRVAPQLRAAGGIATHLIASRAFWFHGVLKEGGDELAAIEQWNGKDQLPRAAAELARGLESTWNVMEAVIARWAPADLAEQIILPWIGPKYPINRGFVVWHVLEHDLHHGGELTQTLGMSGLLIKLPPPPPED